MTRSLYNKSQDCRGSRSWLSYWALHGGLKTQNSLQKIPQQSIIPSPTLCMTALLFKAGMQKLNSKSTFARGNPRQLSTSINTGEFYSLESRHKSNTYVRETKECLLKNVEQSSNSCFSDLHLCIYSLQLWFQTYCVLWGRYFFSTQSWGTLLLVPGSHFIIN